MIYTSEYSCPHCKTKNKPEQYETAETNVEYYGSLGSFVLRCPDCNKKVEVKLRRAVSLVAVGEARPKDCLSF